MISDEKILEWFDSLPKRIRLRDRFNWCKAPEDSSFWSKERTKEEIEQHDKWTDNYYKHYRREYYNRVHKTI